MLFIGYFEGLDGQRGIAWRCADSLALRSFLGIGITEATPVHASMTIIRQRLPESVFDKVFVFVLSLLEDKGLLRGKAVAIDATTLEANAARKSIVRKDSGEDWKQSLRGVAPAALFFAVLALLAVVAAITDRTMEQTLTGVLGGCGLLLVSGAANLCTRCIRSARKNGHSLTGC
jgi:hypothetical protein